MSKRFPECPLYNHNTCKDANNPKVCAIVRKDKECLRKHQKPRGKEAKKLPDTGL